MKKSSKNKIARIYSTALYEAAEERKCVKKVCGDIAELQKFIAQNQELSGYLISPLWKEKDKVDVVKKTASILRLSPETEACLEIIVENRRVGDLAAILDDFINLYYRRTGVAEVEVEAVQKLSMRQNTRLQKVLEKLLERPVAVKYCINPEVLGGLRVRCGSKMFDDSLSAKLNYLEKIMKGK